MIGRNNFGNIRYNPSNKWQGEIVPKKGFCQFKEPRFGVRALCKLIFQTYPVVYGDDCILTVINRFAPPSENKTSDYVDFLCNKLDIPPFIAIPVEKRAKFIYWLIYYEQGGRALNMFYENSELNDASLYNMIENELLNLNLV